MPTTVTSRRLMVGSVYGYVRNPIYLVAFVVIIGEALLISRAMLLIYAAGFNAALGNDVVATTMPSGRHGCHIDAVRT